jgi:serine/threonine-protein kinase
MLSGHPPAGDFEPLAPDLDRVVRRALARDPAKRPQTIAELRRELEQFVAAREPGPSTPTSSLPPEEILWLRAVALLLTVATAGVLWAIYVSSVPRVLEPGAVEPLVMISRELADGRTVAYARFDTGPALAALLAVAVAAAVYGLLHRHWRRADLLRDTPDAPIPQSRRVLWLGAASCALYLVRLALERLDDSILVAYVPLLGAALELVTIFVAWVALLEARRTSRPLRREPLLWLGLLLAFIPPVHESLRFLTAWTP